MNEESVLFSDLVELKPEEHPKGGYKTTWGEGWALWIADRKTFAVVNGVV